MSNLNPLFEHEFIYGVKTKKGSEGRKKIARFLRSIRRGEDLGTKGRLIHGGIATGSAIASALTGFAAGGPAGAAGNAALSLATSPSAYIAIGAHKNKTLQNIGNRIRKKVKGVPIAGKVTDTTHDVITDNSARARALAKGLIGPEFINRRRRARRNKELGLPEFKSKKEILDQAKMMNEPIPKWLEKATKK